MTSSGVSARKKKPYLFLGIAVIVGAVAAVLMIWKGTGPSSVADLLAIPSGSDLALRGLHHVASRNGATEWELDAATASFDQEKHETVLRNISARFLAQDGSSVYVTAQSGSFDTQSNDMTLEGTVTIHTEDYALKTETLQYFHTLRTIVAPKPVEMQSSFIVVSGDTLTYDLNANRAQLKGHVEGTVEVGFGG
ncbi:LPS export ABC transporter periplasmic protein LptC [Thermodesulfobacteriota bacterium]